MLASAAAFALVIWDGDVTRLEGAGLLVLAIWLLIWLYRASPVFVQAERDGEDDAEAPPPFRMKAFGLLVAGVVHAARRGGGHRAWGHQPDEQRQVSETFLGMTVVGMAGVVQFVRGRAHGAGLSALLAVHWAWSGVVDHARCFSGINPAAWPFVVLLEGRPAVSLPS